ncbi:MAG: polysaccharide biosynthesis/export family protein [Hyphomicrobiaceae bacterium]|nr:polysaccharide biosynthesis/export family protein [Hyphomicrobiaceae bacterium]
MVFYRAIPVSSLGLVIGLIQAASVAVAADRSASDYLLAPQDKLRISVLHWLPGAGNYQEWTALNGTYSVGASGTISMPMLGSIRAQGLRTDELATVIETRLKQRAGLPAEPDASVEILEYRPFYVVGQVERPGEYAFRPELTTIKALAIAGGLYRDASAGASRERDRINARSALENAQLELHRLLVRRVRLSAELRDVDSEDIGGSSAPLVIPTELAANEDTGRLVRDEERIKHARMKGLASRLAALRELQRLLKNELVSLESKTQWQRETLGLAREERDNIAKLLERNLVVNSRRVSTQQAIAEHEARLLDLDAAALRVKQELSKADRDMVAARADLRATITTELQTTEAGIDLSQLRISTAVALLAEASGASTSGPAGRPQASIGFRTSFVITRRSDGGPPVQVAADENTPMLPGDVLNVLVETDALSGVAVSDALQTGIRSAAWPTAAGSDDHAAGAASPAEGLRHSWSELAIGRKQ